MTQSQPLTREAAGGELDVSAERRRARILGRILESSHRLHESHEIPEILQALVSMTQDLFPESRLLLLAKGRLNESAELEFFHNDLKGTELKFAQQLAHEVASTGIPPFSADFEVTSNRLAACVPLCAGPVFFGALYGTVPYSSLASSDELTHYLRLLGLQAGTALNTAFEIQRLGEDLTILSSDAGVDMNEDDIPLTIAKRAFERWLICARLHKSSGNIAAAARALKMDRGQLSRLVKRHKIDPQSYRP